MRGTEAAETGNDQASGEREGEAVVSGGSGPDGADALGVGSDDAAEGSAPPVRVGRQWKFHRVYALVDGRDDSIFYIGYTSQKPIARLNGHCHDRHGAAYERIKEIRETATVWLRVLSTYRCASEALAEEYRLINKLPNLVNRHRTGTWSGDVLGDQDAYVTVEPDGDFLESAQFEDA